jgi:hypothetical protein
MKNHNQYTAGIPDVWYSGSAADLWVEYKFIEKIPVRASILPNLSALQQEWLRSRYEEGRNVMVIVGCKSGAVIYRDLEWEIPLSPEEFSSRLLDRTAVAKVITQSVEESCHGYQITKRNLHHNRKPSERG